MNLIEVYIQEVTRRLPEKNREDIALELRSTIEDMLPDSYSEENVKEVLEKMGNPVTLASRYRDKPMHLIGPRYFEVYVTLLKMILPIATVASLVAIIPEYFNSHNGQEAVINVILDITGIGIWRIIEVGIQVFFWLTIVFAILERVDIEKDEHPLTDCLQKWTPDDLRNIPYIPKKKAISKFEVFGSLLWIAIWATVYFNANHFVGVYEGGENGLEFVVPVFNQDVLLQYSPIVISVIVLQIVLVIFMFIKGQWTKKLSIYNAAVEFFGTIVFIVLLLNPNVLNIEFITYMSRLFSVSPSQFEMWIVGGVILIYITASIYNIYVGFRKAKIRKTVVT